LDGAAVAGALSRRCPRWSRDLFASWRVPVEGRRNPGRSSAPGSMSLMRPCPYHGCSTGLMGVGFWDDRLRSLPWRNTHRDRSEPTRSGGDTMKSKRLAVWLLTLAFALAFAQGADAQSEKSGKYTGKFMLSTNPLKVREVE